MFEIRLNVVKTGASVTCHRALCHVNKECEPRVLLYVQVKMVEHCDDQEVSTRPLAVSQG